MKRYFLTGFLTLGLSVAAISQHSLADDDEAQRIAVNLKEWDIGFHEIKVDHDKVRFDIRNDGTISHAFELEGKIGGKEIEIATPLLSPGEATVIIVELPKGEYEVYCPVPGHEERGMKGEVVLGRGSPQILVTLRRLFGNGPSPMLCGGR